VDGGYSFYIKDKKLCYAYNYVASQEFRVVSTSDVPEGKLALRFEFKPTGKPDIPSGKGAPGHAELYVNDKLVGQGDFPYTIPLSLGLAGGIAIGRDEGAPVTSEYQVPFAFTGRIVKVTIDASGETVRDKDAEMRAVMAHQ
jgi:arylsulfatase